jgi:hypothetical protein
MIFDDHNNNIGGAKMLTWTKEKPHIPGWYWMLTLGVWSNLPMIVQVVFDRETHRWLALIPASHYPKNSSTEMDLQTVDAMWTGPLDVPSVLAMAS